MITMEPAPHPLPHFPENSYKMTEEDVKRLIEFRASNEALFTGKRNSAKIAWSTILKGLGLEGKLTADQIAKKWDNLRTKYKDLKQPYQGQDHMGGVVESWPWFHIMDEAMQGRLYNSNLVLSPETAGNAGHRGNCQPNQNQENTDILEFLIKTEMEDTVAAETAADDGGVHTEAPPPEGIPMGWRRMTECSYKMSEQETERMIKLRAANEALFTGRKHSAKPAWRGGAQTCQVFTETRRRHAVLLHCGPDKRLHCECDLKFPPRGMEGQTNPASWPWFQLMSDALEGRLTGKAPRVTPVWTNEEDGVFGSSPPPDRDCLMAERSSVSELESMVGGDNAESDGNVTYIDASGEECSTPSDPTYKMTDQDTRKMIKLRAANEALFTGRRNAAKAAWK
ncbi:uncharacterized protein LOC102788975 [Neolamprologus brichardi]|uniref:uncharacterized protein LOC102788975 n=1 Tax=Neolamprologus brichardi TaxID=32507 RepID=UPI001643ABA9|nr:uncharacterized protein LOC102788975 [Neolamprologus brichardi]